MHHLAKICHCHLLPRSYRRCLLEFPTWSSWKQYCTEDRRKGFPKVYEEPQSSILNIIKWKGAASTDFLAALHKKHDFSIDAFKSWWRRKQDEMRLFDQRYIPERHQILGPDLASAHFVVHRKGAVKFCGEEQWIMQDEKGNYSLPANYVPNLYVEEIDASGSELLYEGFDNLVNLRHLKTLKLRNCPYIDDWCLDRLNRFRLHLEHLDISGCPQITEHGLPTLYRLRKLKTLHMENLTGVNHLPLVTLLLQEVLPECVISGVQHLDAIDESHHLDASDDDYCGTKKSLSNELQKESVIDHSCSVGEDHIHRRQKTS